MKQFREHKLSRTIRYQFVLRSKLSQETLKFVKFNPESFWSESIFGVKDEQKTASNHQKVMPKHGHGVSAGRHRKIISNS